MTTSEINFNKPILSAKDRALLPNEEPAPAICLVNPQMGENIGAAARAMANFGLEELLIVNPRDGWPNEKAVALSAGATWPLDNAKLFKTTSEAIADKTIVFATTGTPRQIDKPLIGPMEAVKLIQKAMSEDIKPVMLFGSERFGLSNEDIIGADYLVTYPTNFRFPSLNLAQSIAIFCFLWATKDGEFEPKGWDIKAADAAPRKYFDSLFEFLLGELDEIGFFWPEDRRENMVDNLRAPLVRAKFSESEINLFRGALRVISEGPRRRFIEQQAEEKRKSIKNLFEKLKSENKINQDAEIKNIFIDNNNAALIIKSGTIRSFEIFFKNNEITNYKEIL